jgi:hypothetical protein
MKNIPKKLRGLARAVLRPEADDLFNPESGIEEGERRFRETRPLFITVAAKEELANAKEGEEGFVLIFYPEGDDRGFVIAKLEIPGYAFGNYELRLFAENPDIRIVPYRSGSTDDDEHYIFAVAINIALISHGIIGSYVYIKDKKPIFLKLKKDHGFQANELAVPEVRNNILMRYMSRVGVIFSEIHKMSIFKSENRIT